MRILGWAIEISEDFVALYREEERARQYAVRNHGLPIKELVDRSEVEQLLRETAQAAFEAGQRARTE